MRDLTMVLLLVALVTGCESAPKAAPEGAAPPAPAPTAAPTSASAAPAGPVESATYVGALNVDLKASTRSPSGLVYRDLKVGTGAVVVAGQSVEAKYAGWLPNGTEFDHGSYTFVAGAGRVIAGWDEGVVGMRVGGKRQLIVPPELGYGAGGNGPIPPNAVLVFAVEVVTAK